MPARQKKNPPRIPPAPSCGAETRIPPNFRKISLGFANPPPAKLFRKTESAFVFSVSPHFCFSRSSVLRTEALQRAGNASIQYHQDCFQKRFEFCTMNTVSNQKTKRSMSKSYFIIPSTFSPSHTPLPSHLHQTYSALFFLAMGF
jgi:hypothetical protein